MKFSKDFDSDAKSLVKRLTKPDLSKRFGHRKHSLELIRSHRFFKNTNWVALANEKVSPPYIPSPKKASLSPRNQKEKVFDYASLPEKEKNPAIK